MPVYAFVNPRAYSAGALIALSAKAIYMRPGAVLGAATPVDGQGVKASEKMVSAMRGRVPRAGGGSAGWTRASPRRWSTSGSRFRALDTPGQLLTLSTDEALRVGYAKASVSGEPDLLAGHRAAERARRDHRAELGGAVVRFLTNPLVAPLLLSLGVLGPGLRDQDRARSGSAA